MKFEIQGRDKEGPIRLQIRVENQFAAEGVWLRGNLHFHAGQAVAPSAACEHYRNLGFDFLAFTDYAEVTPIPQPTLEFVTLGGAEMSGALGAHIVCVGLRESLRPPTGTAEDIARMVRDAEAQGGLAILAHPYWSSFSWERLLAVAQTGIVGLEVSNRVCWKINGKERSEAMWQMLLDAGIQLAAIGSDDSHGAFNPVVTGRTWTGLLAHERTPPGVLEAIRARRTYASESPILRSVTIEPRGVVLVECSECTACHFMSRGSGVRSICPERPSERFELALAVEGYRMRDWLSVCLEDAAGRRAWSSAIPVEVEVTRLY